MKRALGSVGARAAALTAAALLLFDYKMLIGRAVWGRDLPFWVVPSRALLRGALSRGELPRWDHAQGIGAPVLVNPLHGVFYPPTLLSLLTPLPWWTTVSLWLHTLLGALGVGALAGRMGCSLAARVTAAIAWSLSGPTLSEWTSGMRLPSLAWTPWIAIALSALLAAPSARSAAGLALPLGMALLAGEPFVVALALLFALLAAPASEHLPSTLRDPRRVRKALAFAALGVTLGALLASASLIPTLAGASGTQRAGAIDMRQALHWSVHPARALDLFIPGGLRRASEATGHAWSLARCDVDPLFFSHYLGASALALALIALRRERRALTLAGVAALAMLLAMGRFTPLYAAARWLFPPLRIMRSPEKLLDVVALAVALLAALGLDRVTREPRGARNALALCALLAAFALDLPLGIPAPVSAVLARGALGALVPLAAVGVSIALSRKHIEWSKALLALCVFADLTHHNAWLHPFRAGSVWSWRPPAATAAHRLFDPARAPGLPRILRAHTISRYADAMREYPAGDWRYYATLPPNLSATWDLGVLPPYDVAVSPALESFLGLRRVDVARLLAVDATMQPERPRLPPGTSRAARVGTGVELLAIERSLPRVYPVGRATPSANPRAAVLAPVVVDGAEAVLQRGAAALDAAPGRAGSCALITARDGVLDARCVSTRDAFVVFVEQHAPGWRARVDGRDAAVIPANLLAMGVRVPAGAHRVTLRYEPPGVIPGLAGSALGVALALLLRRRRREPAARGEAVQ